MDTQSISGNITVWQNDKHRWISIDGIEQSRINKANPYQTDSPVHKAFLATLLFIDFPKNVLVAGLGGGTTLYYLNHFNNAFHGDAIEIDPVICNAAHKYFRLPTENWTIHNADIRKWHGDEYDLMLIDIADHDLTPDWLVSDEMIFHLKHQLSIKGAILFNLLVANEQAFREILIRIREIFGRRTVCLSLPDHRNIIVMAFNTIPAVSAIELDLRCQQINKLHNIDLSEFVTRIERDNPVNSGVL